MQPNTIVWTGLAFVAFQFLDSYLLAKLLTYALAFHAGVCWISELNDLLVRVASHHSAVLTCLVLVDRGGNLPR